MGTQHGHFGGCSVVLFRILVMCNTVAAYCLLGAEHCSMQSVAV